jgi:hypothetical protein
MPRTVDPSTIPTGGGLLASELPTMPQAGAEPLGSHLGNPLGAHPATAIAILDPYGKYVMGPNVEGALNELSSLVPPPMGGIGSAGVAWLGSSNVGTPDWGTLKLRDGAIPPTGNTEADVRAVYPYYYRAPVCPDGVGVTGTGVDPSTDPVFNYYDGAGYASYTGGGEGQAHAGFATISMGGAPADGFPSWRILPASTDPAVVVSGIVSPSDRGVLALVRWPAGNLATPPVAATSVSDIQDRCIAAILLGKGIESGGCDGTPGGIFEEASGRTRAFGTIGFASNPAAPYTLTLDLSPLGLPNAVCRAISGTPTDALQFQVGASGGDTALEFAYVLNQTYYPQTLVAVPTGSTVAITFAAPGLEANSVTFASTTGSVSLVQPSGGTGVQPSPFTFPGRASGQYNLEEIHTGTSVTSGPRPFLNPAAGQVRLLTDPAAFPGVSPATTSGGLPILGGTANAIGTSSATYLPFGLGGGTTGNFFAYRLPYLKDYSVTTGIHFTTNSERARFTAKLPPASPGSLTQAGNYSNFTTDFWAFQIARYRHRFTLASGSTVSLRRDRSFALVHFKKEATFERYVRDGVVPDEAELYSVNLVSWSGVAQLPNTFSSPGTAALSYSVERSEVLEDPSGSTAPTLAGGASYTVASVGTTMWCSGIEYYVPRDRTVTNAPALGLRIFSVTLNGLFANTYRSHDKVPGSGPLSGDQRKYALGMNPVFMSLASFSYEGAENPVSSTIANGTLPLFPGGLGEIRRQRIEFGYADLTGGADNPSSSDTATISGTTTLANGVTFAGDPNTPVFTQSAKVRVFFRRPLGDLTAPGATHNYPLPYVKGNTASNRGFTIPKAGGETLLYHSMRETSASSSSESVLYGNPFTTAKAVLNNTKDRSERFLDEVYRYPRTWTPLASAADTAQLVGPGLPGGLAPVAVPVRPISGDPNYPGWYFQGLHSDPTSISGTLELQVAGLPARNPDAAEGVTSPFPSRGLLLYPQKNYSGYLPAGANYSALTGDRSYVRVFDGGAANVGTTLLRFKIWGVDLTDFAYVPGGPGGVGLALQVKIPGLTTWMDAGRVDGSGPSKQDPLVDGAGCLVVGPNTFSGVDPATQIRYSQIEVNLGPTASLFLNTESPARCPVLVSVILKDNATGKGLNFEQGGEDGPTVSCRGIVGIDIL